MKIFILLKINIPPKYYIGTAYLAESSLYYRQLAIASDFGKIFEISSVYRAYAGLTHRHLTESISLDFEMEISEHFHEIIEVSLGKKFARKFQELSHLDL